MPPKIKFTKENIIDAAVNIIREKGVEALSARNIAKEIDASTKPIFMLFKNMEDVKAEVLEYSKKLYEKFSINEIAKYKETPYKAYGMGYIDFAIKEKELFKFLFMRERVLEEDPKEQLKPILEMISKSTGLNIEESYMLHIEMWLFIHGIATTIVTGYGSWSEEIISKMLTDVFIGLKEKFIGDKNASN